MTAPTRAWVGVGLAVGLAGWSPAPAPAAARTIDRSELLAAAEAAFAEGVTLRDDSARARPAFARAAAAYDELWTTGEPTPALALNRAHAHRLAGDLPRALAALNAGLAVFPWHRPLQMAREEVRALVAESLTGGLAAACRPPPPSGLASRVSPAEAWLIAAVLWLLAWAAVARFAMTRTPAWLGAAALAFTILVGGGFMWERDRAAAARSATVHILAREELLRTGNAVAYPPRLEPRLPRGVEVRWRAERGGWAQVELAGGAVGWLPADALLPVTPDRAAPARSLTPP